MNNFFLKIKSFAVAHKIIAGALALVIIFGGYQGYKKIFTGKPIYKYATEAVERSTISVTVTGSGQVSELNSIDLKPLTSGALIAMNVKKGDQVKAGQVIAVVDQRSAITSIAQAKASLASAQANYDELIAGASVEDLRISENSVKQAENSYNNAILSQQNTINTTANNIAQAQQTLDDLQDTTGAANPTNKRSLAIATLSDKLNVNQTALDAENRILIDANLAEVFSVLDSSFSVNTTNSYNEAIRLLDVANDSLHNVHLFRSDANLNQAVNDVVAAMNKTQESLNYCFEALRKSVSSSKVTQSQIDSYKSTVSSQLSSIASGISSIQTAVQNFKDALIEAQNDLVSVKLTSEQQLASAKASVESTYNSWQTTKDQLAKLKNPPTTQELNSALSSLTSARTQLQNAVDTYNNTTITAPFDGQIAAASVQKGDQVSGSTVIATLITNQFVAVISLNEVDVAKIKLNDTAVMTFDAIDGLSITGKIIDIDTLGTVSQGVVTYNVKVSLDLQYPQVKPGMSTNVSIITETKIDVIAAPNAAIKSQNGNYYVQMLNDKGKPYNVFIETGITDDSYTEIISGLQEGDEVVTQTVNINAQTSATSNPNSASSAIRRTTTGGTGAFFMTSGPGR